MNHQLVEVFNCNILKIKRPELRMLPPEEMRLALHQLREEIQEIEDAYNEGNLVGVVDGLIDLDYYRTGVIYRMGIKIKKYNKLFLAVHEANMKKVSGRPHNRLGFTTVDATKPEGWEGPEKRMAQILLETFAGETV